MNSILQTLLSYVLIYRYAGIFIITYLGAIALPLPSGTIMMAAAAFATQGYFNFWAVLFTGIAGNVAGDNSGYWLARLYGKPVLEKIGFRRMFDSPKFETAKMQIDKHPIITIYITRFMTAIAPAVNVACGLTRLDFRRYIFFEVLGECSEVTIYSGIGLFFGSRWNYFSQYADRWIFLVVGGMIFSFFFWKFLGKKTKV